MANMPVTMLQAMDPLVPPPPRPSAPALIVVEPEHLVVGKSRERGAPESVPATFLVKPPVPEIVALPAPGWVKSVDAKGGAGGNREPAVRGDDVHGSGRQPAAAEGEAAHGCAEIGVGADRELAVRG
jgi:hypothetical protein